MDGHPLDHGKIQPQQDDYLKKLPAMPGKLRVMRKKSLPSETKTAVDEEKMRIGLVKRKRRKQGKER
jgi:hypothetical protein